MRCVNNEAGSVLVFVTLMVVLLMIMIGMGLDTGQLTYTRSQGQSAVDAAALSAVSGLPLASLGNEGPVTGRVGAFNSTNDYVSSPSNQIGSSNITYVQYNDSTGAITDLPSIAGANGVRVALENTNPYSGANPGTAIATPAFLTPLMKIFGYNAPASNNINVSAVAALKALPGIPIAVMTQLCNGSSTTPNVKLRQTDAKIDNSCWTTYTENPPSAQRVQELFAASRTCSGLPAATNSITVGTPIELNNGQQASTYEEAYDLFIANFPGACWYVPVIPNSTKCNQTDPILDWAKICPTDVVKQTKGNDPKYILASVSCQQNLFSASNNLCFSSRLVREPGKGY
jgi:Flp pilus assembly protein TadG